MEKTKQIEKRAQNGKQAITVGLISNLILAGLKTSIGILGHSTALLADGINSTSDVAYYIVVSIFVRMANKPADDEHPYGHSQLESIGALIVGSFVITTAVTIFWNSINSIFDFFSGTGDFMGGSSTALYVALGTIIAKIVLTKYTQNIGKKTNNPSITALAYDHRNDIFSALAAVIGIFLGRQGYYWVDPLAGALVALVILRTGIEILRESTSDLMDTIPGKALKEKVTIILSQVKEINQIESITAHRFGPYLVINLTICIDGALTVYEGDQISSKVETLLYQNVDFLQTVHVHFHPCKGTVN